MNEESLFAAVLDRPTEADRQAYLRSACGHDADLLCRMYRLLASHEQASGILDRTHYVNGVAVTSPTESNQCGVVIGPFVLKELLGEGGFGQVYAAEQFHPVKREVAIKLIKPGMNSREVLARFEGERQALALMDHGNIARVYEAGTTESSSPYFVMELVRGAPITDYADQHRLSTIHRLKLFQSVCHAVHHAHQKGILHRDLKPSNVLVTTQDEQPTVKVIDFGVAKALHQPLVDDPFLTQAQQMIGTPAYMSPEQAGMNGHDVDTRTDIYSLGVMLYELLVGATPFDRERLLSAGYDEMRRIIREEDPPCPSTRISALGMAATTVSTNRQASPRQLSQLFRGELDWIVMKAMEKDRDRRYASASDLARDVNRYLDHEPIEASPPSSLYRMNKFLQRNRHGVLVGAAMLLLLIGGIIGTTLGMLRAWDAEQAQTERAAGEARERLRAVQAEAEALAKAKLAALEAETSTKLVDFLRNDVLSVAGLSLQFKHHASPNEHLTVREAIDRAAAKLEKQLPERPDVEGRIRFTIGASYLELGLFHYAEAQLKKATTLLEKHLGPDQPETQEARNALGCAYRENNKVRMAIEVHEKLRDHQLATLGPEHPHTLRTLNNLAIDYRDDSRFEESLSLLKQLHASRVKLHGPNHEITLVALRNLALLYLDLNQHDKAIELHEDVVQQVCEFYGPDHPETLIAQSNLATAYWKVNRLDKSVPLFEQLLPRYEKFIGTNHLETHRLRTNLGVNLRDHGRIADSIQLLEKTYEASEQYLSLRGFTGRELLQTYLVQGDRTKVRECLAKVLQTFRRQYSRKPLAFELTNLSSVLINQQYWKDAEPLLREAITIWEGPPMETVNINIARSLLGQSLFHQARHQPTSTFEKQWRTESEALLLQSYREFTAQEAKLRVQGKRSLCKTVDTLIEFYEHARQADDVRMWQAEKERLTGTINTSTSATK